MDIRWKLFGGLIAVIVAVLGTVIGFFNFFNGANIVGSILLGSGLIYPLWILPSLKYT